MRLTSVPSPKNSTTISTYYLVLYLVSDTFYNFVTAQKLSCAKISVVRRFVHSFEIFCANYPLVRVISPSFNRTTGIFAHTETDFVLIYRTTGDFAQLFKYTAGETASATNRVAGGRFVCHVPLQPLPPVSSHPQHHFVTCLV